MELFATRLTFCPPDTQQDKALLVGASLVPLLVLVNTNRVKVRFFGKFKKKKKSVDGTELKSVRLAKPFYLNLVYQYHVGSSKTA